MFSESTWGVFPFQGSVYRERHQLQYPRKGHPDCLRYPYIDVYTPGLWQDYSVCSLHVVTDRGRQHFHPHTTFFRSQNMSSSPVTLFLYATIPCLIQMKTWVHNISSILHCFLQSHPIELAYHCCQCYMYPDGVTSHYTPVGCIEYYVVFTRRQSKPMVCLLNPADYQKNIPHH